MLLHWLEMERYYNGCGETERELNVSGCYRRSSRQPCDGGGSADPAVMICNSFGGLSAFLATEGLDAAHQYQPAEQVEWQGQQIEQQEM